MSLKTVNNNKSKKVHNKPEKMPTNAVSKKSKTIVKKQKPVTPNKEAIVKSEADLSSTLASNEQQRKNTEDEKTIYIKFKEILPSTVEEIKELHPDIKFVRNPQLKKKKPTEGIRYAFLEFETVEVCKNALTQLTTAQFKGQEVFVDFVGENSKNIKPDCSDSKEINPKRLFICGLAPGITKSNLKEMFPKAAHADMPNKSKNFGFVQFSNADDAKDAFDAAQDLSIANHKITVLFAKTSANKGEVKQKKEEKRKARKQGRQFKDASMAKQELGVAKKGGSVTKKNINKKIKINKAKDQTPKE